MDAQRPIAVYGFRSAGRDLDPQRPSRLDRWWRRAACRGRCADVADVEPFVARTDELSFDRLIVRCAYCKDEDPSTG